MEPHGTGYDFYRHTDIGAPQAHRFSILLVHLKEIWFNTHAAHCRSKRNYCNCAKYTRCKRACNSCTNSYLSSLQWTTIMRDLGWSFSLLSLNDHANIFNKYITRMSSHFETIWDGRNLCSHNNHDDNKPHQRDNIIPIKSRGAFILSQMHTLYLQFACKLS